MYVLQQGAQGQEHSAHCACMQDGGPGCHTSPANGGDAAEAARPVAPPEIGGDRFASIAQAPFAAAAAAANPDASAAAPARQTFMMRSAAAGRRWQAADVQAVKSSAAAPASGSAARWGLGASAAAAVVPAGGGGELKRESILSRRGESPAAPPGSASLRVPVDSNSGNSAAGTFLGMPPLLVDEAVKPEGPVPLEQTPAAAGEGRSNPRGWHSVRAAMKSAGTDQLGPTGPAAPAEPPAPQATIAAAAGSGTGGGAQANPPAEGQLVQGAMTAETNPDGCSDSTAAVAEAQGSAGEGSSEAVHALAQLWLSGHSTRRAADSGRATTRHSPPAACRRCGGHQSRKLSGLGRWFEGHKVHSAHQSGRAQDEDMSSHMHEPDGAANPAGIGVRLVSQSGTMNTAPRVAGGGSQCVAQHAPQVTQRDVRDHHVPTGPSPSSRAAWL